MVESLAVSQWDHTFSINLNRYRFFKELECAWVFCSEGFDFTTHVYNKEKTRAAIQLTDRVTTFALGAEKRVVSDWLTVPANFCNRLGPKLVALMENNMGFFFPRQITRKREKILMSKTSKIDFRDFSEEIGGYR